MHSPRAESLSEQLRVFRERGNAAFSRQDYGAAERWYEKALAVDMDDGVGEMNSDHAAALSNLAACALSRSPADPVAAMLRL